MNTENLYANTIWQMFIADHPLATRKQPEIFRDWLRKYINLTPTRSLIQRAVAQAFR